MSSETQIEALRIVLECLFDAHPSRRLALTQIDRLIAELQVNVENSLQLQGADPLGRAVEQVRMDLAARLKA